MKQIWNLINKNYLSDVKYDYTIKLENNSIGKQITVILLLILNAIIVPPKTFVKAFIQELFLLIISIFRTLFVVFVFPLVLIICYWGMILSLIVEYIEFSWKHRKNDN